MPAGKKGSTPIGQFVCGYCGKVFERKNQPSQKTPKFCSPDCASNGLITQVELICPQCNKSFYAPKKEAQRRIYCSRECRYAQERPWKERKTFSCEYCGKAFERLVPPKSPQHRSFCSPTCRNKARTMEDVVCPVCGKFFRPRINDTKNGQSVRRKFCSAECGNRSRRGTPSTNPARRPDEEREFVKQYYPIKGAQWVANELDVSIHLVRRLANRMGVKLTDETRRELIHNVTSRRMRENNPMRNEDVKQKVKQYWQNHPEEFREHYQKLMEGKSRLMKNKPSKLEQRLWEILNGLGIEYESQRVIKPKFIVDIMIDTKLIIQADGDYWHGHPRFEPLTDRQQKQQKRDHAQDKYLTTCGYTVERIWECNMSEDTVKNVLCKHGFLPQSLLDRAYQTEEVVYQE